eukprot:UN02418
MLHSKDILYSVPIDKMAVLIQIEFDHQILSLRLYQSITQQRNKFAHYFRIFPLFLYVHVHLSVLRHCFL